MSTERELVALEHRFWDAAGDGDFYRTHMAEDGLCLLPPGVLDRDATADAIDRAAPWTAHRFHDVVTFTHGGASATLCYRADAQRGDVDYRAAISTTYRRSDEGWELLVHQQTPLQGGG